MSKALQKRVILVAIGGASCSGKTLLAKHLKRTLVNSHIIHQDDFAPPEERLPFAAANPEWRDWDDPATCVEWQDFRRTLAYVKETGEMPEGHTSHDHLNELSEVAVDEAVTEEWRRTFAEVDKAEREKGVELVWYIIDGFVLYWDQISRALFDVRVFLRVPCDTLKARREARQTYVTQDGSTWVDPPKYFEGVVYPAYQKAHAEMFQEGDVEHGSIREDWRNSPRKMLTLIPGEGEPGMTDAYRSALRRLLDHVS